jgi:hypothetical protein
MESNPIDVRAAIGMHLSDKLSGTMLLRVFMLHRGWRVPVSLPSEAGGSKRVIVRKNDDGKRLVRIFTDAEAVKVAVEKLGRDNVGEQFVETTGHAAFSALDLDLDFIDINPGSEPTFQYQKEHMRGLLTWAAAVKLEQTLAEFDDSEAACSRIKHYRPFFIVINDEGEEKSMVMAPDEESRRLAAVFTAEDCLERFRVAAVSSLKIKTKTLSLSGEELCALLSGMTLDGVVFNCVGPVRPVAFSTEIAKMVMAAP